MITLIGKPLILLGTAVLFVIALYLLHVVLPGREKKQISLTLEDLEVTNDEVAMLNTTFTAFGYSIEKTDKEENEGCCERQAIFQRVNDAYYSKALTNDEASDFFLEIERYLQNSKIEMYQDRSKGMIPVPPYDRPLSQRQEVCAMAAIRLIFLRDYAAALHETSDVLDNYGDTNSISYNEYVLLHTILAAFHCSTDENAKEENDQ